MRNLHPMSQLLQFEASAERLASQHSHNAPCSAHSRVLSLTVGLQIVMQDLTAQAAAWSELAGAALLLLPLPKRRWLQHSKTSERGCCYGFKFADGLMNNPGPHITVLWA